MTEPQPAFPACFLSHPKVLDGLFIPIIIPVEFPQDDFEICCLDEGDLPQVSNTVGGNYHSALIDQGTTADQKPGTLVQATLLACAGPPVDGCLPWPACPLSLWRSSVLNFPTDCGENTS